MTSIKPISFKPEMIEAVVSGRKTQTRRIIKKVGNDNCIQIPGKKTRIHVMDGPQYGLCPYANMPGDLMYVRESWKADRQLDHIKPSELSIYEPRQYLADGKILEPGCMMIEPGKYRPAMFMPRAFSRLTLEATNVRAEILTHISEEDAEAEGIAFMRHLPAANGTLTARQLFKILFTSINGPESWARNDWVWVTTFKPHFCNVNTLLERKAAA